MKIQLFETGSPRNSINKKLENMIEFDAQIKGDFNILNPVFRIITTENLTGKNYCYVPELKRYYFVDSIVIFPINIYVISFKVDVLETWKNDILKSKCSIMQQKQFNKYYNGNFPTQVNKEIDTYKSETEIEYEKEIILCTIGG